METEESLRRVAQMVLQRLEEYLQASGPLDPQKCKHITGTLKDIRDLQPAQAGPGQLVVVFDRDTREAAQ